MAETKEKKTTRKKKKTSKEPKKILKSAKDRASVIEVPEDCAALVFTPNGKINVYISEQHENEEGTQYAQHEELAIAIAAMMQNESFVTTTLNTFRNLFEMAIQKSVVPENSIDD